MSVELVIPSNHLILCCLLLLLPSIFSSIRVFSNESALHIRWPKYWSFSFSISPSDEHPGLISFRMDWFDLLAVQGTLKNNSQLNLGADKPLEAFGEELWCPRLYAKLSLRYRRGTKVIWEWGQVLLRFGGVWLWKHQCACSWVHWGWVSSWNMRGDEGKVSGGATFIDLHYSSAGQGGGHHCEPGELIRESRGDALRQSPSPLETWDLQERGRSGKWGLRVFAIHRCRWGAP